MLELDAPVTSVEGVGRKTAADLEQLDIVTVRDLVEHYPRRYEDLGEVLPVDLGRLGEPVTVVGTVVSWQHRRPTSRRTRRRLDISEVVVRDRTGSRFRSVFFNQPWRDRQLPPGTVATWSGTLEYRDDRLQMSMPSVQILGRGPDAEQRGAELDHQRLIPVYPATESLPSWKLERLITTTLDELPPLDDFLPGRRRAAFDLLDLDEAVRAIHAPDDHAQATAARRRLKFDELFTLQVGLQWRRARLEADVVGIDNRPVPGGWAERFLDELPFEPTGAQRSAMLELAEDLGGERPMHRLLQGDVGSGKTLVATWTMLCAVDRGRQAALMAPTEILAEQHFRTLSEQLAPLGVNVPDGLRVELLTSGTTTATRRRVLGELLSGRVDLIVGTHALLEEGVRFDDLGVVVIDEQHRFGVHQRIRLMQKGGHPSDERAPDVLVMTATPIPRSLALTVFGDLEVTVLDELPPGRHAVRTELITPREAHRRARLYDFIRSEAAEGRQAYVVCPLVEPSSAIAARAATTEHERLRDEVLPDLRVGLVHGQMRAEDKDAAMAAFRRGELDVLVATTVIEVGVDVPSATMMVIEDAERYGISQLHQLRGRVGRGADRSFCVLFAGWSQPDLTDEATERLAAVVATTDGFELAEKDLELRGEGELFGVRQSGMPDLKLARLARDFELVVATREAARDLVAEDPELAAPELRALRREVVRRYRGGLEELAVLAAG